MLQLRHRPQSLRSRRRLLRGPISLLLTNGIGVSYPDIENHILPSQLFLKIPIHSSCVDGIRKSSTVSYKTRPPTRLPPFPPPCTAASCRPIIFKDANPKAELSDPSVIAVGTQQNIPLSCTCLNNSDNNLPAIYMSYVVRDVDTLAGIAVRYVTTVNDLMNVNALGSADINGCDILSIPLSDYGLVVPNGSYTIIASHCMQCSCGYSNLMIGNVTTQQSSAGCNVTSCSYAGYVNRSIGSTLSTSLQSRCPGSQQFPPLMAPRTVLPDSFFTPAPSPSESGSIPSTNPKTVVPSSGAVLGFPPATGPAASLSDSSSACYLTNHITSIPIMLMLGLIVKFL